MINGATPLAVHKHLSHCPSLSGLPAADLPQRSWDISSLPPPLPRAETWSLFSPLLPSRMTETSCNSHQCHLICSQLRIGPLHTFHRQCRGSPPGIGTLHCPRCHPGILHSQSTTGQASLGTSRTCVRSSRGSRQTSEEPTSWYEQSCAAQTRYSFMVEATSFL